MHSEGHGEEAEFGRLKLVDEGRHQVQECTGQAQMEAYEGQVAPVFEVGDTWKSNTVVPTPDIISSPIRTATFGDEAPLSSPSGERGQGTRC